MLVGAVADAFAERVGGESTLIELGPLLGQLGAGPFRKDIGPDARRALDLVEAADLIVVGSPAYRATYTGLFKLFFDHVGQYAIVDKPIVLTATGGSDRHALLVEHQMRPLFGFFQALTLPLGIFANEGDFADYRISRTTSGSASRRRSIARSRSCGRGSSRWWRRGTSRARRCSRGGSASTAASSVSSRSASASSKTSGGRIFRVALSKAVAESRTRRSRRPFTTSSARDSDGRPRHPPGRRR